MIINKIDIDKLDHTVNFPIFSFFPVGFRTHGIDLHEETQLQWMSEHLSYPDNFLHLSVDYENVLA